jgi:hypothetical protein
MGSIDVPLPWDAHICLCGSQRCELMQGCYLILKFFFKKNQTWQIFPSQNKIEKNSTQEMVDNKGTLMPRGISKESDGMGWYLTIVNHKWPLMRHKHKSLHVCLRLWLLWLVSFIKPICNIPQYKQEHSNSFLPLVKEIE